MSTPTNPLATLPSGDDLGMSRGTDVYGLQDRLADDKIEPRDRVRQFSDAEVVPRAAAHWEAAEMPDEVTRGHDLLGIAGGSLRGHGCPGLSPLLVGIVVAEVARGDGSLSTLRTVRSGLAKGSIGRLGSEGQKPRRLPAMAAAERTGAFALTEPDHGSDVAVITTEGEDR